MHMHMHMHICTCTYAHAHHMRMHMRMRIHMHMHMHAVHAVHAVHACLHICTYTYAYMHIHLCMHHVHVHVHAHACRTLRSAPLHPLTPRACPLPAPSHHVHAPYTPLTRPLHDPLRPLTTPYDPLRPLTTPHTTLTDLRAPRHRAVAGGRAGARRSAGLASHGRAPQGHDTPAQLPRARARLGGWARIKIGRSSGFGLHSAVL